jgi:hypothetical protein
VFFDRIFRIFVLSSFRDGRLRRFGGTLPQCLNLFPERLRSVSLFLVYSPTTTSVSKVMLPSATSSS